MSFYQPGAPGGGNANQSGQPSYPLPYPGRPKAPTSFGTPAMGFQRPPTAMPGMPQPHQGPMGYPGSSPCPYPSSNPAPYPGSNPPYPGSNSSPYPGSNSSNYPGSNPAPYPSSNAPYPGSNPSPYPSSNPPYPGSNSGPYPGSNPTPYPSSNATPYPSSNPPYPGSNPSPYPSSNPPYPGSNTSPYPGSNPNPYPGSNPSPYPGSNPSPYPGSNSSPYPGSNPSPYPSLGETRPMGQQYYQPVTQGHAHQLGHAPGRNQKKPSPTVFPADNFNARADAEVLRKAMKGFGTDEKSIIEVLANRNNAQRLEIAVQFKTLYGKDLIKNLKSELTGRFEDLVVAMMTPLPQYIAAQIEKAMRGLGTDEETLIEVFCTMTNDEIATIRAAYEAMYNKSLEDALIGETSGNFRRLLVSLCCANRDESDNIDPDAAMQDAQALLQAGELKYFGTDESTFNMVLCQRNYAQLRLVFDSYRNIVGHDIEEAIKNEFSGDIKDGLLAIVGSVRDKATFFAKRLHQSMKGLGTNDEQLIRIVVTRTEVDMGDIKNAFLAKYGETLESCITGDTSGDYKKCLLALIN